MQAEGREREKKMCYPYNMVEPTGPRKEEGRKEGHYQLQDRNLVQGGL
jgi:hypothetical protein